MGLHVIDTTKEERLKVDEVLELAKAAGLTGVLVLGYTDDNKNFVRSTWSAEAANWHLDWFKAYLLRGGKTSDGQP